MGMRESRTEREWEPESGREMGTNDRREELRRWTTAQKSVAWHSVASIRWAQLFIMGIKRRPVFSLQQAAKSDSERIVCSPSNNVGIFFFPSQMWRQRQDRTFSRSMTRLMRTCAFRTHVKNIIGHLKQSLWKTPSRWKLMRHPVCSVDRHKLRFWETSTNHWWNQLCFVIIWVWTLTWGLGLQLSTCTYICHIINNISLQHTEESTCIQSLLQHILFMLLGAGDLIPLSSYTLLYSAAVTSPIFFYSVLILTLFSSCCPCSELHVRLCKYTESNLKNGKVLILKHILISKVT